MRGIFVFGSNLAGRHGKGAALYARQNFGAEYGVGEGLTGESYAIPTKDENLRKRPHEDVAKSIQKFADFARRNPNLTFLLTPVGCGLAGFKKYEITAMLRKAHIPKNVFLTSHWIND